MRYQNVYGQGPWDDREPLYHSEPYWLEVDRLPSCKSQIGTFIDNYSHVCIDIGVTDESALRVATRFNSFHCIVVAGDQIGDVIRHYTSIIGRPRLKPRYALGNHQGCYGYDTQELVLEAADNYRKYNIPLDGMAIDVDMQQDYRTFTIDTRPGHFPNPERMFSDLRKEGIKCCTNITPYISSNTSEQFPPYQSYEEAIAKGYVIMDEREIDPSASEPSQVRYQQWNVGNQQMTKPDSDRPEYFEADNYNFGDVYNSKTKPFHGGIFYGWGNGHPGVYPNLNNEEVRVWWGKQYKYLFESGLDFVWQDMTSPCIAQEYGDMKS